MHLVLGHEVTGALDEIAQVIPRLRPEPDDALLLPQPVAHEVEAKGANTKPRAGAGDAAVVIEPPGMFGKIS